MPLKVASLILALKVTSLFYQLLSANIIDISILNLCRYSSSFLTFGQLVLSTIPLYLLVDHSRSSTI